MNTNDIWKKNVLDAVNDIADESFQRKAWLTDSDQVSSPEEVYCNLIGDNVFQEFLEDPKNNINHLQKECGNLLIEELEQYFNDLPQFPDPGYVITDPKWNQVRLIAEKFLKLF